MPSVKHPQLNDPEWMLDQERVHGGVKPAARANGIPESSWRKHSPTAGEVSRGSAPLQAVRERPEGEASLRAVREGPGGGPPLLLQEEVRGALRKLRRQTGHLRNTVRWLPGTHGGGSAPLQAVREGPGEETGGAAPPLLQEEVRG